MEPLLGSLAKFAWANLGHCGRCMAISFRAAAASWAAFLLSLLTTQWSPVSVTLICIAGVISGLWLGHLVAFGYKVVLKTRKEIIPPTSGSDAPSEVIFTRRKAFTKFCKVVATAALATSLPSIAKAQVPGCFCTNGCAQWCGPNCAIAYQQVVRFAPNCGAPSCSPTVC